MLLTMAAILIVVLGAAIGAGFYARVFFKRYVREREERERAISLFSRYLAPPVVEELLARKDSRLFEAREYYATILCTRIRNFALFTEALSASETLRYLNEFYTIVGQAVQRHRGMIESLRGDTVVAVFGVLVEEKFQEERALRAGLEIMRVVRAMEARWESQNRKAFAIGMGVNSGKIVAGDTGFQARREFAVVGNPTNIAARLEAASEELNASIVASDSTYDAVRDLFVAVPTSSLPLRGLRRLQNAFIIRGLSRRAGDEATLTIPPQHSIAQTNVVGSAAAPHGVEAGAYIGPHEQTDRVLTDRATVPPHIVDERVSGIAPADISHFSLLDDERPEMPAVAPAIGTYEDNLGPPFALPP